MGGGGEGGGRRGSIPIPLNEIQTMFSQLAKQSWRHQSADSCIAHKQNLSSRSVNKTRNMAADAGAKCGGFFLVYSTIFFLNFEALQFGKFTSWRTSFLKHSSFSEIKVRQHLANLYVFALKKPLELVSLCLLAW